VAANFQWGMVSVAFGEMIADRQLRSVYRIWAQLAARGRLPSCDEMIFASLSRLPPPILLWSWMPWEQTFRFALDAQGAGLPPGRNLPGMALEELCTGERYEALRQALMSVQLSERPLHAEFALSDGHDTIRKRTLLLPLSDTTDDLAYVLMLTAAVWPVDAVVQQRIDRCPQARVHVLSQIADEAAPNWTDPQPELSPAELQLLLTVL
jgi:hypothetical protein